ncbi:endo alpha-1,4 polygalactosaminidase [Azospirillum sp.]|uniref:endo alpha-1,4 polygalactosaminidase n=1 Tax=Azospirillum sp. TaxID=34012 RepID=UPI003D75E5B6
MAGVKRAFTAAVVAGMTLAAPNLRAETPWVVYYADKEPLSAFEPYTLVVLDSEHHPPLRPLKERGKTLLGYISLGEVESHRPWYETVKGWGILSAENPNWPGSFYVDVRDKRWTELVVAELVPALLRRGFDGIFLDTLDNPPHLERTDPKAFAGMTEAAARLVKALRRHYPGIRIMQNRGYELLPQTAGAIDYALGESVTAGWDFAAGKPHLQPPDDTAFQVEALAAAKRANPALEVMTLDYWDPNDAAGVAKLYATERARGFSPYVATVELDRVVREPKP